MKTNSEIRKEAWDIVRSRWLGRIVAAGGSLYLITIAASVAVVAAYLRLSISTWPDFLKTKFEHARQGLDCSVPSMSAVWQMTGASVFQQFIAYVFGAILLFGLANLMLKAARDDGRGWFAATYAGFRRPFEVLWLLLLMNLKVFLWSLLLVIPGIVAIYRYRQAWYLKGEHPDWGAGKCLAESGVLMKGFKAQAFWLDLSYFWRILLAWLLVVALLLGSACAARALPVLGILGALFLLGGLSLLFLVGCCFLVARAVFYRELAGAVRANEF